MLPTTTSTTPTMNLKLNQLLSSSSNMKEQQSLSPFVPPLLRPWQPQSPISLCLIRFVVNVSSISRKNPRKKKSLKKWETEMLAKNWEESACGAKLCQCCQLSSVTAAAWVIADISADMRRVQLLFATKSCQYAENLQRALSFKIL